MSEVRTAATREGYGAELVALGAEYPNLIVMDADLAGATKTGMFKKAYPDRFFDCGIAEGNMMGIAAGLATTGKIPVVSSFAMFAAGRAYEQIRNSIGYPKLNVKIGATHAGITVGEDGASHQCNEDIALMRSIPGMVILCPSDEIEARVATVNEKGCSLLLYKDARCDMNILDETVGAFNWCKKFYQVKNTMFCSVGIKDKDTGEWVFKDDCGDDDFLFDCNLDFYQAMRRAHIPCQLRVRDGGHTWEYWHSALYEALPFVSRVFGE